jgi:putative Holliday junction resolvase
MRQRILAIDPGEKRIGVAISDPTGTIANPLTVLKHVGRLIDAAAIAQIAAEQDAARIIVGQALDSEGLPGRSARHAAGLAEAIRSQSNLAVELWDESSSTQMAQEARRAMGVTRKKRAGHADELAATVILQSYLDHHPPAGN